MPNAYTWLEAQPAIATWIPLIAFGVFFVFRLIAAPYWIYKADQANIKRPQPQQKKGKPTQRALDVLGTFLSEGIGQILNRTVTTEEQLEQLKTFNDDWNKRLFAHLDKNFPKSDALHVQRLGTIHPKSFGHVRFEEHARILSHFCRREEHIRDLIKRGPHQ